MKNNAKKLNENELNEIFMSQIIEESEGHRKGEVIGRDSLLAENRDFEDDTSHLLES